MALPHWIGIPGVILLIGLITYGFRQGGKLKTPNRDGMDSGGFSPPSDSSPTDPHG
ncbi:hypothetical protein HL667_07860 [Bradyrhizobium sp. 83012]|uniref:Uncharacterized protein n=1 Tax=Bradyrhizobium aeschynomenes TaxID=2734909 RepID=A0ABX2CC85_9BRAD|nr:hypothetical protein [Bradyrhizobium aeschynomenes]NPU64902.1 hypothetical protein [Bradyrhizobium aeschynomenes]NPV25272.1 hypothetical protein [Bradyrhizobium aeschynomenes]